MAALACLASVFPVDWEQLLPGPTSRLVVGWLLLALVGIGLKWLTRVVFLRLDRWDGRLGDNPRLDAAARRVGRLILLTTCLMAPLIAALALGGPPDLMPGIVLGIRLLLTLAAGVMLITMAAVLLDIAAASADRRLDRVAWRPYVDRLRRLVPEARAYVAYGLWLLLAAAVLAQLPPTRALAIWPLRLAGVIGILLLGRITMQLLHVEVEHRMLPDEGLSELERRRRATLIPLVQSALAYVAGFVTLTLMLSALDFNVMPFLAGAGVLGLVVGFGAQSLINDVVSGFFILFENIYLVGELIEVGAARGTVEAIEFRTTRIRDAEGRLHIIRNGDMKPVINYSRDYTVAVVVVDVSYDADLPAVFAALEQTGQRLHGTHPDVLADTVIEGIVAFGGDTMTVRTSTRVRPGRHDAVAAALRLLIKQNFDLQAEGRPRRRLIPEIAVHGARTSSGSA